MVKEYTVKIDGFNTKRWYQNGLLHREGGPAIECSNVIEQNHHHHHHHTV
jgi:hypothetical protein